MKKSWRKRIRKVIPDIHKRNLHFHSYFFHPLCLLDLTVSKACKSYHMHAIAMLIFCVRVNTPGAYRIYEIMQLVIKHCTQTSENSLFSPSRAEPS